MEAQSFLGDKVTFCSWIHSHMTISVCFPDKGFSPARIREPRDIYLQGEKNPLAPELFKASSE